MSVLKLGKLAKFEGDTSLTSSENTAPQNCEKFADEFVLRTIQRSVILRQITLKLGSFNNLKAFFP